MKRCFSCGVEKALDAFGKRYGRGGGGPTSSCKACVSAYNGAYNAKHREKHKAYHKQWYAEHADQMTRYSRVDNWEGVLVNGCRNIARKKKYAFDLDADFIRHLFVKQQGRCHWLGLTLTPSVETRNLLRPSVDRLDCAKGYTRDNVVLACQFANMGRSVTPPEQFSAFVANLEEHFVDKALALPDPDTSLADSVLVS